MLAAGLALPLAAQKPAASSPRQQISYTEQENPNLSRLRKAIDTLSNQEKLGNLPPNGQIELNNLRTEAEILESQRKYFLNIEFQGGPLAVLLENIGGSNFSLNIISPGSTELLKSAELPAFTLRNSSMLALTKVVGNLVEAQGYKFQVVDDTNPNHVVGMLSKAGPARAPMQPPTAFESIQLDEYLHSGLTIDDIVDAIRSAWELSPKNDRDALKLKYHPPTKILLVSGPTSAIIVTKTVVGSLRKKPSTP